MNAIELNKKIFLGIIIWFGFLFQACSNQNTSADEKLIHQQNRIYMDGYNNKNPDMVAELHTDDVFVMPPNNQILRDKEAVKKFVEKDIQSGARDLSFTTLELKFSGNHAYEVGASTMKIGAIIDTGKYIVVWEKQKNGEWLIKADIWNTDLPK